MHPINKRLLELIRSALAPSTGCTEPAAIALNAATARVYAPGPVDRLIVRLDPYLFKNAMGVGIPGSDERGVALCAALGVTAGDADAGMNALHTVTADALREAKALVPRVALEVVDGLEDLYVETRIYTPAGAARAITYKKHDSIARVEKEPFAPFDFTADGGDLCDMERFTLADFCRFARDVPIDSLAFLQEAVEMNQKICVRADDENLDRFVVPSLLRAEDSPFAHAKRMAGMASYARMSGVALPVMTATGSGNQGITLYLTMLAVSQYLNLEKDAALRAMALGSLVNLYVKSRIGPLSSVCACGVASGLGASMGIVRMLGGGEAQMLLAARNILGSVCGMICDGAKEGCANKVALSAGLAVESAYLAIEGVGISPRDGILDDTFENLVAHLARLVREGMGRTNSTIVHIMKDVETARQGGLPPI
jgi:L-cysteine desulfidase